MQESGIRSPGLIGGLEATGGLDLALISATGRGSGGELEAAQILRMQWSSACNRDLFVVHFSRTIMRCSVIRAVKGFRSVTHAPKSVSRSFASVKDGRQQVYSSTIYHPEHLVNRA